MSVGAMWCFGIEWRLRILSLPPRPPDSHNREVHMPRSNPDYHINWSTKGRLPQITPELEPFLYSAIVAKAVELGGFVHAVNGDRKHVHLVVRIPVRIAVADFIGRVKGYSSRATRRNTNFRLLGFEWQDDYDVEGISRPHLQRIINYVQHQKDHHRSARR